MRHYLQTQENNDGLDSLALPCARPTEQSGEQLATQPLPLYNYKAWQASQGNIQGAIITSNRDSMAEEEGLMLFVHKNLVHFNMCQSLHYALGT
jgi:hypothetical protein